MTSWRARCGVSRTPGSEGGPGKRTERQPRHRASARPYTHFPAAGMAVTVVEDLVSRKWIAEIVSSEETSTQIQIVFTDALEVEGLLEHITAIQDGLARIDIDDPARPVLLAVSDNGTQMTSGSTREFMALAQIAQHFGRAGTPTDQAHIESLFGHLKVEHPYLLAIKDPQVLRAELAVRREHYNGVRLSLGVVGVSHHVASGALTALRATLLQGCGARGPEARPPVPGPYGSYHVPSAQKC